jgi:hypothetical protein
MASIHATMSGRLNFGNRGGDYELTGTNGGARMASCLSLRATAAACLGLLAMTAAPSAAAQAADAPSVAQACLNNAEIRRTRILGDRNIVFVTRSNAIYNNQLPRQCPNLRPRSLINYPVANARICAGYRFAVLFERGPGDFVPTSMCELGSFVPITEAEVEDLATLLTQDRGRRSERRRTSRDAMTTRPVELPPEAAPAGPSAPAEPDARE